MEIIVTPKKEQIRIDQVTGKKIKLRVAAYARVSTDLEDQRNSFEFQKEEFESRIKQNPEWEFVKMYADHGISGTQVKHRKGFLQMIHDADNGKIDLILTKSISRFARNTVDLLTYVRKLAAENVSIFFEKENIMTNRDNVNLILTMYASIAESESINISDNVKWGVRKRMKKNSLKVPVKKVIGYSRTDDGTWYLNDDAQLAKNVFIYFLQGYTYRQIVELMKNDDKEGKFQWRPNTIHRILTNEKYKGFVIHQKTVTLDPLTHKQVKNNGIEPMYTIRDHHPKIVDEETFDLVQLILKRGDKETPTHSNYFPLAGLVVCEECGRTLRRIQYAHNKEIVLTCKGRSKQDLNYKECSSDVIPYHAFKEITKKVINEIKQSDSISSSFTMNLVDELSSDNYIPEINKLNRQIEDTKKEINDLVKEQVNSTEMVGYDSKFKILKTKLKNLQNEVIRYENLAKKNFSLIKNKKQIELFLSKNDMDFDVPSMRDIIYQVIHKKDGSLRFILKGSNANDGIRYTLTCSSNRSTLTCRESESVFIHDLRNIILEQIKIIKNEPLLFKKLMTDAFNEDLQPINDKIALINTQIDLLKSKIATYSGKHNEAYRALSDEITGQVENLMNEKKMLENRLLTHENYERMIKETMKTINELSMTEYDPNFRKLFKKVIIKSRTDLTFIIGNENVDNLDLLNLPKVLNSKYQIKVRAQLYNVDFGIYFNR